MSLILEALRKSEAERQLGRVPGLTTPMATPRSARSRGPVWLAMLAVATSMLALAVWFRPSVGPAMTMVSPHDQPPALTSPAAPVPRVEGAPADSPNAPAPTPSARAADAGPTGVPSSHPAPTHRSEQWAASAEPSAELPRDAAFESTERESTAQPVARSPSAQGLEPATAAAALATSRAIPEAPANTLPVESVRSEQHAREDVPALDQLDPSLRQSLPPLKLSMHVFADAPADRFVLIDGRRYGEGESVAESLQLVEIRRDGSVLDFNGTRFLLRRP